MSARTLISVEDYLASAYEPDCDYVDGHIEERNAGELSHSMVQLKIGAYLLGHYGLATMARGARSQPQNAASE